MWEMRESSIEVVSDPQDEFQKVWNVLKLSTEFSVCTNFSKERVPNFHQPKSPDPVGF